MVGEDEVRSGRPGIDVLTNYHDPLRAQFDCTLWPRELVCLLVNISLIDLLPMMPAGWGRVRSLMLRSPTLDHPKLEFRLRTPVTGWMRHWSRAAKSGVSDRFRYGVCPRCSIYANPPTFAGHLQGS
jgi:hypothetical protein